MPTLKAKRIAFEHEWACKQFLVNMIVSGYRIINPDGEDITQIMIDEAAKEIQYVDSDRG